MSSLVGSAEGRIIINIQDALSNIKTLEDRVRGLDGAGAGALSGLEGASTRLGVAADKADAFSRKNREAGIALAGFGALVTGAFGVAVGSAANFEQQMSGVQAVVGSDVWEQFGGELQALALQLGKDTVFGATDAAGAIEELAKQGISAENILGGAADATTLLAAASGTDLVTSAEIAATAMNQFGLAGKDVAHIADVLTNGANKSSSSVESLGDGLQYVGTTANTLGIPLDDTVAALAALEDQGLKGSQAGTSLNRALSSIANPSSEAATAMDELGLSIGQTNALVNDDGSFKDLGSIIENVNNATKDLTDVEKQRYINQIFGEQGGRAINALLNTQTDELKNAGKGWDDYTSAISETGTAQEQAEIRLDNFRGSWEQLMGTLETISITIGSRLLGPLRSLVDFLAKLGDAFLKLPTPIQNVLAGIVGLTGLFAGLAGAAILVGPTILRIGSSFLKFASYLPKVAQGIRLVSLALRALVLSNPLLLALAAIFALLFIAYQKNIFGFGDAVRSVAKKVEKAFKDIIKVGKEFVKALKLIFDGGDKLQNAMIDLPGPLFAVLNALRPIIEYARQVYDAFQNAVDVFQRFREQGVNPVSAALQAFGGFIRDLKTGIEPIDKLLNNLADVFRNLGQTISAFLDGDYGRGFDKLGQTILSAFKALSDYLLLIPRLIADALSNIDWGSVLDSLSGFLSSAISKGREVLSGVYDGVLAYWEDTLKPWLQGLAGRVVGAIPSIVADLSSKGRAILKTIYDGVTAYWDDTLKPWLQGLAGMIAGAVPSIVADLSSKGRAILATIYDGVVAYWKDTLKPWLAGLPGKITGAIPSFVADLSGKGRAVLRSVFTGITDFWGGTLKPWLADLPGKVADAVPGFLTTLLQKGIDLIQGFFDGIQDKMKSVVGFATTLGILIAGIVPDMLTTLKDKGIDLIQGFIDGIDEKFGDLTAWFTDNFSLSAIEALLPDLSGLSDPFETLVGFVDNIIGKIGSFLSKARELKDTALGLVGLGGGNEGGTPQTLGEAESVAAALEAAQGRIETASAAIATALTTTGRVIRSFVADLGQSGLDAGLGFQTNFQTSISAALTDFTTMTTNIGTMAGTWAGQIFPAFGTAAGDNFQKNLAKGLVLASLSVQVNVNLMSLRLGTFASNAGTEGSNAGSQFQSNLAKGLNNANRNVGVTVDQMTSKLRSLKSSMSSLGQSGGSLFASGVTSGMNSAANAANSGASRIRSALQSIGNQYSAGYSIGSSLGQGVYAGINSWAGSIASAAASIVRAGINAARSEAAVASPSKKMIELGANLGSGLAIGLLDSQRDVNRAFANLVPNGNSARSFQYANAPGIGRGGNQYITVNAVKSSELIKLIRDAETGAGFARNMRAEVGLMN